LPAPAHWWKPQSWTRLGVLHGHGARVRTRCPV
jgi:hypothetical protein